MRRPSLDAAAVRPRGVIAPPVSRADGELAPIEPSEARQVASAFLLALQREDLDALLALYVDGVRAHGEEAHPRDGWGVRVRRLDYSALQPGESLILPMPHGLSRVPNGMRELAQPSDCLIEITGADPGGKLLGSPLTLWLRRTGRGVRLFHIIEEFSIR